MKSKKVLSFALAALFAQGLYSCSGGLIESSKFEFKVGKTVSPVMINIVDAKTGQKPEGVSVSIMGKDASSVINPNTLDAGLIVRNGMLELGLKEGSKASPAKPYQFNVVANAEGYLTGIMPVSLSSDSASTVQLVMTKISDLPSGVNAKQATGLVGASGITDNLTIKTSASNGSLESSNVVVERETAFMGEGGKKLTGDLKATVAHFNNQDPASLTAFPGGLNPNSVTGVPGLNPGEGVTFTTAGFVSIDMTVGGEKVTNFGGKKIKINVEISDKTINPETGNPVKAGDVIPTWSMNTETGEWTMEGKATMIKNAAGKLEAQMETAHLSYFNFDWYYNRCYMGAKVNMTFDNLPKGDYFISFKSLQTGQIIAQYNKYLYDNVLELLNSPQGVGAEMSVYMGTYNYWCPTSNNLKLVGKTTIASLCSGTYNITLARPAGLETPSKAEFFLEAYCPTNPAVKVRPSTYVYQIENSCGWQQWNYVGYMYNGYLVTYNLVVGKTYKFWTPYSGYFDYTVKAQNIASKPLTLGCPS